MSKVDSFIENVVYWRNYQRREISQAKLNHANELAQFKETLTNLEDETKKSRETIEKNLNSIMSSKHSIVKTQDSKNKTGLPITNTFHGEFLNFISNSVSLINEFGNNDKCNPKTIIDECELSERVKICNENIMKQIHKDRNVIDEMQTIMESMNTPDEFYTSIIEEELPLSESSFLSEL